MTGGRMGHHGYKRPGCGYILGDCMGVGYAPYPATDALEIYRKAIEGRLASVEEAIAFYRSPECKGVTASRNPDGYFNMPRHLRYEIPYTILRGARARHTHTPSPTDREGELTHWTFVPSTEALRVDRRLGNVIVKVFND